MSGVMRRRILMTYVSPPVAEVIKDGMNTLAISLTLKRQKKTERE